MMKQSRFFPDDADEETLNEIIVHPALLSIIHYPTEKPEITVETSPSLCITVKHLDDNVCRDVCDIVYAFYLGYTALQ
jgi:hypothetical protein